MPLKRELFPVIIAALASITVVSHELSARPSPDGSQSGRDGIETGLDYDRVIPFSRIEKYSGSPSSEPITPSQWKQVYFEMYNASVEKPSWKELGRVIEDSRRFRKQGVIAVALMDFIYDRSGREEPGRVFASSALTAYTHRGWSVRFYLGGEFYFTNHAVPPVFIDIDFDDGTGWRRVKTGETVEVSYTGTGRKKIEVRVPQDSDPPLLGSFYFTVENLQTPDPHDTLQLTASIPYLGEYATGSAYLYLSDGHVSLTDPVIVVEGFDIDNTMGWDEIYDLMNREELLETMRSEGFDIVVLDFTEAADYIQSNSMLLVELIEEVEGMIDPSRDYNLIGASMGGLVGRYALSYMESNLIEHRVGNFISFDTPHRGANIPLGIQYWMDFFSEQSADAAFLLERLDMPASRQMLVYHHTDPPGTTGESDSLKGAFESDLAALGGYPSGCRKVAIANGSGYATGQGFAAGEQIISYEHFSFLVDIVGNVWAVPDGASQMIFEGLIDIILNPTEEMNVVVSGTDPYDSAPGGTRATMTQMDTTDVPYGDIVALYQNHCFIPTISALDLATGDLFFDIAGAGNLMSLTPFDTVYYPSANQEHIDVNAENAEWVKSEVRRVLTGVDDYAGMRPPSVILYQNYPNPFNPATSISFYLPRPCRVELAIYDVRGRMVKKLIDGDIEEGEHRIIWTGRDREGIELGSGVYFYSIRTPYERITRKLVLIR